MLSKVKFKTKMAGMTAVAQKVYQAVPMQEAWTPMQILGELKRLNLSIDFRVVGGCLDTLLQTKLIQEPIKGLFVRTLVREGERCDDPIIESEEEIEMQINQQGIKLKEAPKPFDFMQEMHALSARAMALSNEAKKLSADIEAVAIQADDQLNAHSAEMQKFLAFKALMKDL